MTLTARAVEAAKPREKSYKLADAAGLYLFIAPTGAKSWRCNYSRNGKQATRTYGRYPAMSLAQARQAHFEARGKPASAVARKPTFETVFRDWLNIRLPGLSNDKHKIQVQTTVETHALPRIGHRPVDQITRAEFVQVVMAVLDRGTIETAHRVAGRLTMVMDYAQNTGLLESHAAHRLGRVLPARKVKRHMPSIAPDEAPALFAAIDTFDEPVTRLALLLLAYTFVRVVELRFMKWSELRENGHVWVVPEERMKMKLNHVVPLSTGARKVLAELGPLTGHCEYVLDSPQRPGHPVSENTTLFALYRLGYRGRMTAHGFRALASTVLNERSGFGRDVIERQLAHKESDDVRAAYNRAQYLDQRRLMMQWWSDWVDQQRPSRPPASV